MLEIIMPDGANFRAQDLFLNPTTGQKIVSATVSLRIYRVLMGLQWQIYDWNDGTFKDGPATTPSYACEHKQVNLTALIDTGVHESAQIGEAAFVVGDHYIFEFTESGGPVVQSHEVQWHGVLGNQAPETGGGIANLGTQIGTAGAGLTNIGDTRMSNLNATVGSRSSHTAAAAGTDAASKILAAPAQLLATDASGRVTVGTIAGASTFPSLVITPTGTFAQVGNVMRWDIYTLSANGVPTAPDSTPTANLVKPDGTAHSTLTLTVVATGHYTTTWTPAASDAAGEYQLRVSATINAQTYKASGSVGLGNVATGQGMGLYTRTIQAYIGPATTTPIAGVTVHVWNSGKTIIMAQGATDANGQFVCYVNAATYKVVLSTNSYTFSETTMTVAASGTTTVYGTAFTPTAPSTAAKCTVYGWVKDVQGAAVSGVVVTVSILDKKAYFVDAASGEWVRPSDVTATTSVLGYWEIQLIRSVKLTPTGSKYRFKIPAAAGHESYIKEVTVPDLTTAELRTL